MKLEVDARTVRAIEELARSISRLAHITEPPQWELTSSGPLPGEKPRPTLFNLLERLVESCERLEDEYFGA